MALSDFFTGASDALEELLLERKADEQREFLNRLKAREVESQIADREANRRLQERNLGLEREQVAALERLRDFQRAKDIVEMAGADEAVTPDTQDLLTRTGFGGRMRQDPRLNVVDGLPQELGGTAPTKPPVIRISTLRPGFRYEQAREQEEARKVLAEQNAQAAADRANDAAAARAEQAAAERALKAQIASDTNTTRQMIAAMGANVRNDAAADKKKTAEEEKANKRKVAVGLAEETLGVINQLIDESGNLKPGADNLFGMTSGARWVPGSQTADAEATLNQLVGKSVVDLISEMKSQSKTGATGFGALSEKELKILQDASNKLSNRWQSDASARAELKRIRDKVQMIMQEQGAPVPGTQPTVIEWEVGPDGKPRRKQ